MTPISCSPLPHNDLKQISKISISWFHSIKYKYVFSSKIPDICEDDCAALVCLCFAQAVLLINPIVTGNVRTRKELLASSDSQILDVSAGLDLFLLTAPQKPLFTAVTQNFLNIPFLGTEDLICLDLNWFSEVSEKTRGTLKIQESKLFRKNYWRSCIIFLYNFPIGQVWFYLFHFDWYWN